MNSVPELVVRRLAVVALTAIGAGAGLLALAIFQPGKVDTATVAVIGNFVTLAGTAAGGLGAILASTRSVTDPPQPVTVTNPPSDPVSTTDVPRPPTPRTSRKRPPTKAPARRGKKREAGAARADLVVGLVALVVGVWLLTLVV